MDLDRKTLQTEALSRILEPLIRLCIRNEITYSELMEYARISYVETAQQHFQLPDSDMTDARLAVLTGMSRRHVKHVKDLIENQTEASKPSQNRAQRVVEGWLNDAEFLDKKKNPLALPIKNTKNGKEFGSFVALVKRYSGDITYGAILDELNHARITEQPNKDTVVLTNHAYVPAEDALEHMRIIGRSVSDLFNVALHNTSTSDHEKRLQRQIVYSHIDEELVDELQDIIEDNSKQLIDKLNVRLKAAKERSKNAPRDRLKRVGFGVYYIEQDTPIVKNDEE